MKTFLTCFLSLLLVFSASNAWAESNSFLEEQAQPQLERSSIQEPGTPARKLQRGFLNVVLSPLEISRQLAKEQKRPGFPPSWFIGMARGASFMVVRAVAGVYEMATFPFPIPGDYEPITNPEFPMALVEKSS